MFLAARCLTFATVANNATRTIVLRVRVLLAFAWTRFSPFLGNTNAIGCRVRESPVRGSARLTVRVLRALLRRCRFSTQPQARLRCVPTDDRSALLAEEQKRVVQLPVPSAGVDCLPSSGRRRDHPISGRGRASPAQQYGRPSTERPRWRCLPGAPAFLAARSAEKTATVLLRRDSALVVLVPSMPPGSAD